MGKDIMDYLKYYLGCEIKAAEGTMIYRLNKIGANGFASFKDKNGFDMFLGAGWKPILRKLESMTEEEALNIARRCFFNNDMKYPDSDFKVSREATVYVVELSNDWWQKEIRIGLRTGNIWYTNPTVEDRVHHLFETHHYLLSKGFDLFGLIDAGLAINKETLIP